MLRKRQTYQAIGGVLLVVALLMAGCGGRSRGGEEQAAGEEPAVPTMPAAQFAQPTTMITLEAEEAEAETEAEGEAEVEAEAEAETEVEAEAEAETEAEAEAEAEAEDMAVADTEDTDTDASETEGAELTADQARGLELYTTRKCGDCHGAAAEGVDGQGPPIAGTALTLDEFTDLLRTGGEVGPDHLYGPMMISPSGVDAIHAWLQSLPAE